MRSGTTWVRMAAKNAVRRRLRTLLTTLGVALAVATMFSLLAFQRGYERGMQGELDRLGAHILVVPKGCPYDAASIALHGASWPCYLKQDYLRYVRSNSYIASAAPVFMSAVYDPATGDQNVYLGVTPDMLALKRSWHLRGRFPTAGDECLVGASVAAHRHLDIGAAFALAGLQGAQGHVVGVLEPTQGADDGFVYMPLARAQALFHRPGQLTHILVKLTDPNLLDNVVNALRGCGAGLEMNIVPLAHLFRTIQGIVNSTRTLLACVALIALLVAGAGVSNTILMAVAERTREIGVLRAVGASGGDVFRLIWLETMQVCVAGGAIGLCIAALGARSVEEWLRGRLPFAPTGELVQMEPLVMGGCLLMALALGSIAGLLPAWRAARLAPMEAIRVGG